MEIVSDGTRFFSYGEQLASVQTALARNAERPGPSFELFDMGRPVGEGYIAGKAEYSVVTWVGVRVHDGAYVMSFPAMVPTVQDVDGPNAALLTLLFEPVAGWADIDDDHLPPGTPVGNGNVEQLRALFDVYLRAEYERWSVDMKDQLRNVLSVDDPQQLSRYVLCVLPPLYWSDAVSFVETLRSLVGRPGVVTARPFQFDYDAARELALGIPKPTVAPLTEPDLTN